MPLARLLRTRAVRSAEETNQSAQHAGPLRSGVAGEGGELVAEPAAEPVSELLAALFDWSFREELDTDWGQARRCGAAR